MRTAVYVTEQYMQRKKQALAESGLSADEFAKRAGISRQGLYNETYFSADGLIRFARTANCSIDWLLGLSDVKERR